MKFVLAVTVARYLGTLETREFFLLTHYSIMSPSISQKTSESSSPKQFASLHIFPGEPVSSEDQDDCKGHSSNILSFHYFVLLQYRGHAILNWFLNESFDK